MTATVVQVAEAPPRPQARRLPVLLLLLLLIKMGQFTLASLAVHSGLADPHFAPGIPMVAWDSLHYMSIASHGYPAGGSSEDICFFPVLPLLASPLVPWLGAGLAVLTISNMASLIGLLLFYAWGRRVMGEKHAFWACLLMLAYPPGMFLSAAYTEGIFLVTAGAALYFASRGWPWLAAIAAGIGSAARPTGIMVSLVILVDCILRVPPEQRRRSLGRLLGMGLVCTSGLTAFSGFLTLKYGSPLVYFDAQQNLAGGARLAPKSVPAPSTSAGATAAGNSVVAPGESFSGWVLAKITTAGSWNKVFAYAGLVVSVLILIPRLPFPRHIAALPLLIFLLGYLPNWGARLNSCARYLVEALPLFAAVAFLLGRRVGVPMKVGVVLCGFAVQCLYIREFTRGEWAG